MDVTIVTNGHIEDIDTLKSIVKSSDYVICADGAAKYFIRTNIYPDLLVGDLDSIDEESLKWIENNKVKVEKFPVKKDMTDTELAIEYAIKKSPSSITILGATGSRIDHSLANIMLLYKIHKMGIKARIINKINEITITDSATTIPGKIGQTISIIPINGSAIGVTLKGLEYPLNNHTIDIDSSLGVSNRFTEEYATISVEKGTVLVIKVYDEK